MLHVGAGKNVRRPWSVATTWEIVCTSINFEIGVHFFFYFHFIAVVQRVCKMQLPNTIFTVFCNESVYKIACRKIMTTNRCNEHE